MVVSLSSGSHPVDLLELRGNLEIPRSQLFPLLSKPLLHLQAIECKLLLELLLLELLLLLNLDLLLREFLFVHFIYFPPLLQYFVLPCEREVGRDF